MEEMVETGYKMLTAEATSILDNHMYPIIHYPLTGEWVTVPGNGAYVAVTGGLTVGGRGPLIVRLECDEPTGAEAPEGVRCYRRVRVLEVVHQVTYPNRHEEWYQEGVLHRDDGPAFIRPDGYQSWYRDGKLHREDGPAITLPDAYQQWCREGMLHRESGPAVIYADGHQRWYRDGQLHREGGPAVIYPDGGQEWYQEGVLHRDDGPAFIRPDGYQEWYREGVLQQESGPGG